MVYKFFDKNSTETGIENKIKKINKFQKNFRNQLLEISKKPEKCVDLADIQLISKYNKGTRFLLRALLCVLTIISWVS